MGYSLSDGTGIIISRSPHDSKHVYMWLTARQTTLRPDFQKTIDPHFNKVVFKVDGFLRMTPDELLTLRDEIDQFISEQLQLVEVARNETE